MILGVKIPFGPDKIMILGKGEKYEKVERNNWL